ncbi:MULTISPECIES: carboxyl transferase domain-containing protein [Arthrobacter]|uniref:Acetyl-coenzyme A carboxylase carboxyl transferase subunits beta/alpha n=1 Tax=Arthrobacter terricola TaxID=2547396 RepID=A0A4R5KS12_9MICC|nr:MULTISPECIES: carboxyl transferase domain-containing protein [Arthrobacter]MBT8160624.1 acetyl-CoA carboxylase carboxyltransferase subunit alpha/beta [Arthrobacter sp. GN70]TDF97785.1 acetyl-CoA carboxyl transferase [Arthrobacter terricola]
MTALVESARRLRGVELFEQLLDPGSFRSWDRPVPDPLGADASYLADLAKARQRSGADESVLTGEGRLNRHPVAVIVSEFSFMGGSIGRAAANRIVAAIEEAGRRRIPLIAAPASGGTRMQEGTLAFLQMVRITEALTAYKRLGLPYLVYLRHPTTGGVFASWGSLGHVTAAEPSGLIGFLGPKVYAGLTGQEFPEGVQRSENLLAHGTVDAVLDIVGFRQLAAEVLGILSGSWEGACSSLPASMEHAPSEPVSGDMSSGGTAVRHMSSGGAATARMPPWDSAWDSVQRTRDAGRPGLRELLDGGFGRLVRLNGTGRGALSASTAVVLAQLEGRPVVVVGQDRAAQRAGSVLDAAALAQARRGMRLAEELRLPLVTVVDTPGAELSVEAEESAIAGGIADCIAAMLGLTVPSVAVLLGEGTGGGALALAAARRTVAAEHAWLAPLPPEGASLIVNGDTSLAAELGGRQRIVASALFDDGAVDDVVAEGPGLGPRIAEAVAKRIVEQLA